MDTRNIFKSERSAQVQRDKSKKGMYRWKLIFLMEFATKKEAINFETKLKKLRNKAILFTMRQGFRYSVNEDGEILCFSPGS